MKRNFIISVVLLAVCFGLVITALVFTIMENSDMCAYFGLGATAAAFMSCLFGLGSWQEK